MAITVKEDLVEGANYAEQDGQIQEWTRTFMVTGLNGQNVTNRLRIARNAVGIDSDAAHPNVTTLKASRQRVVRVVSSDAVIFAVTYSRENEGEEDGGDFGGVPPTEIQPENVTWEFGGGLAEIQTAFDKDFQQIIVSPPDGGKDQPVTVGVREARDVFRARVRLTDTYIGDLSRLYKGKLNSVKWPPNADDIKDRRGTWLCSDITATSPNGGETWDTTFEFQHNRYGWQPKFQHIDSQTGQPHKDNNLVLDGNGLPLFNDANTKGWGEAEYYEYVNFNALNLFVT